MSWFDGFGKKQVEEPEDLKNARYNLNQAKEETKRLEKELLESKANERKLKLVLQSKCKHPHLVIPKNKEISSNFNDYFAKCDCCDAEMFDHARSINFLNNLIDQLSKISKVTESTKIVGGIVEDEQVSLILKHIERLIEETTELRNKISKLQSFEYNSKIKERVIKKSEGENLK